MSTLLVLGATSDIAQQTALTFARDGWNLILAGRDVKCLKELAQQILSITGSTVELAHFDALEANTGVQLWEEFKIKPDAILCAVGLLGSEPSPAISTQQLDEVMLCNFCGLIPILERAAGYYEAKKAGCIIGISSVAGERGRASNYYYGSAKAGFTAFLSGLRNRLYSSGVQVITVKPGYVATRMTAHKKLPPLLTASPEDVAKAIYTAYRKKQDIVYCKKIWAPIMFIFRHIPEAIFKRLHT